MSSSILFKVAGAILLITPIGHTQMAMDLLNPGLEPLGGAAAAYSSKVSWHQANGYFVATALLCFNWATKGVQNGLDKYIWAVLLATHGATGLAYARRKMYGPPVMYWTTGLLMGIAGARGL